MFRANHNPSAKSTVGLRWYAVVRGRAWRYALAYHHFRCLHLEFRPQVFPATLSPQSQSTTICPGHAEPTNGGSLYHSGASALDLKISRPTELTSISICKRGIRKLPPACSFSVQVFVVSCPFSDHPRGHKKFSPSINLFGAAVRDIFSPAHGNNRIHSQIPILLPPSPYHCPRDTQRTLVSKSSRGTPRQF